MWKANGKTTTLLLFLDSLFQKQIEGTLQGRTEMMVRRGRRRKQVLDDLRKRKDTGN
jgi:hypothetical protein